MQPSLLHPAQKFEFPAYPRCLSSVGFAEILIKCISKKGADPCELSTAVPIDLNLRLQVFVGVCSPLLAERENAGTSDKGVPITHHHNAKHNRRYKPESMLQTPSERLATPHNYMQKDNKVLSLRRRAERPFVLKPPQLPHNKQLYPTKTALQRATSLSNNGIKRARIHTNKRQHQWVARKPSLTLQ